MATTYDLIIDNARLPDESTVTIGISNGTFTHIGEPLDAPSHARHDAQGNLVTSTFVNGHMHLEKVYTLPMMDESGLKAYTAGGMGNALASIDLASEIKKRYDREWILPNVRKALKEAVKNGVLHMQAFVDVDTTGGLEGMHAVLAAREEFAEQLEIQVVAFPQDGLVKDPGAAELCEQALDMGADVVGGIPWIEFTDADALEHITWACAQAAQRGIRVAMLVDDAGDPSLRTTAMLAEQLIAHDLVGKGTACHARAVGTYDQTSILRLAGLAKRAGLGFISDPHTGPLHLPVETFLNEGLNVGLGQDDIEDAYYPWGRHNMLEVAFLGGHLLGFRTNEQQATLIEMITNRAAAAIGINNHEIALGNSADFCVHHFDRVVDVLREHAAPAAVYRRGKLIAETDLPVTRWA